MPHVNSFHLHISDIHDQQIRKLRLRKYYMHLIMSLMAILLVCDYTYFYHKVCSNLDYYMENPDEYTEKIDRPLGQMIWITFVVLAIILFCVGTFMLRRLRVYFKGFFVEYGRSLWVANVLLSLPLCFRAILDAMRADSAWSEFWFSNNNNYRLGIYNFLIFFIASYIPVLTQTSSLIFGLVRNKQVKIMDKNAGIHKDLVDSADHSRRKKK